MSHLGRFTEEAEDGAAIALHRVFPPWEEVVLSSRTILQLHQVPTDAVKSDPAALPASVVYVADNIEPEAKLSCHNSTFISLLLQKIELAIGLLYHGTIPDSGQR